MCCSMGGIGKGDMSLLHTTLHVVAVEVMMISA